MSCGKVFAVTFGIVSIFLGYQISKFLEEPKIPNIPSDQWWGPGQPSKVLDKSIKPFKIEFTPKEVEELKKKLKESDYHTPPLESTGFEYGFNNDYLKQIVNHWQNEYNFTAKQIYLNRYPHFKTNIQGLDIHYIHVKPQKKPGAKVLPLLLLHGWPGSFVEFYKAIPLLSKPRPDADFVFELIIPSLPGYGYSQAASKPGLGTPQVAMIMKNLMDRIGHSKYVVQGGDWGSIIGSIMAVLFPDNVIGYHTNMPIIDTQVTTIKTFLGSFYPSFVVEKEYEHKLYPMGKMFAYILEETGYMHLQSTKPDTIGVALRDSPVGLAAYILEKFSTWTNPEWKNLKDGGLTKKYDLSYLLDNIMIYWDSKSITTSMRFYAESINKANMALNFEKIKIQVPSAVARFINEITFMPKWHLESRFKNLVQLSTFNTGGHFAAFEEPELLANDVWEATKKFTDFHNNKKRKDSVNKKP